VVVEAVFAAAGTKSLRSVLSGKMRIPEAAALIAVEEAL
jgi:hypothetical protein